MANITDAEAINFVDTELRPICELMRALDAKITAAQVKWNSGISSHFDTDADVLIDGRADDGVSVLTGADVKNAMTQMGTYDTQMEGAGVRGVISKPTVRALNVS
jgi:hypothetical protein